MSDYIKREDAIEIIARHDYTDGTINVFSGRFVNGLISAIPSADVRENVKGKWILHIDDLFPEESTMECNQCHEHQPVTIDDNFCPNCGAQMIRGES